MKHALWIHTLTPLHCGTGQISASVIDLPVAREKATNFPVIPATSLKGVLRDAVANGERDSLFGYLPREKDDPGKAGDLQFGDGRLVCFPVRAWKGVFAYVSCPLALKRLARDFTALGVPAPFAEGDIPEPGDKALVAGDALLEKGKVYLEDLDRDAVQSADVKALAAKIAAAALPEGEHTGFVNRFALISDDLFDFLTETATEVTARVSLNDKTKTVENGPFYEEAVPAEAIFVAPVIGKGDAALPELPATIQIGGNETVGRGVCRIQVVPK